MMPAKKTFFYVPALDGLRAVAVLLVMLSHVGVPGFAGGGMGVDMFFVLSGFLITTLLLEEIEATDRINILHFYIRRLLRLYPALLLMLVLFAIFCDILRHSLPHAEGFDWGKDVVFAGLYLTDYAVALGFENKNSLIAHTWSLAVEEHFYLVWPWVLLGLRRQFRGRRLVRTLAVLYIAATGWRILCLSYQPWDMVYFRFDTRLAGLVLGALLAAMRANNMKLPWAREGLVLSSLAFVFVIMTMTSMRAGTYEITVAEVFTFFLIARIVEARAFAPRAWLAHKVPVFFGRISYALYLFHFPAASLLLRADTPPLIAFAATGAIATALAWFSWTTVEKAGRAKAREYRRLGGRRHLPEEEAKGA